MLIAITIVMVYRCSVLSVCKVWGKASQICYCCMRITLEYLWVPLSPWHMKCFDNTWMWCMWTSKLMSIPKNKHLACHCTSGCPRRCGHVIKNVLIWPISTWNEHVTNYLEIHTLLDGLPLTWCKNLLPWETWTPQSPPLLLTLSSFFYPC